MAGIARPYGAFQRSSSKLTRLVLTDIWPIEHAILFTSFAFRSEESLYAPLQFWARGPTDMPWNVREMHRRHPDGHVFRVGRGFEAKK
jgi:hypothetical protein